MSLQERAKNWTKPKTLEEAELKLKRFEEVKLKNEDKTLPLN
ncbi:MAG: hypothetical protein QW175_06820 [Candidatus Bathyarchaeia archaeon]